MDIVQYFRREVIKLLLWMRHIIYIKTSGQSSSYIIGSFEQNTIKKLIQHTFPTTRGCYAFEWLQFIFIGTVLYMLKSNATTAIPAVAESIMSDPMWMRFCGGAIAIKWITSQVQYPLNYKIPFFYTLYFINEWLYEAITSINNDAVAAVAAAAIVTIKNPQCNLFEIVFNGGDKQWTMDSLLLVQFLSINASLKWEPYNKHSLLY